MLIDNKTESGSETEFSEHYASLLKGLPEVGAVYHPTVGGEGSRGRKPRSRKIVACRQINFVWYVDIIVLGPKVEEQTIRLISFRIWIRKVEARVEKPVVVVEETPSVVATTELEEKQVELPTQLHVDETTDGFSPEMVTAALKARLEEKKKSREPQPIPPKPRQGGYRSPWEPVPYFRMPAPEIAIPPDSGSKKEDIVTETEQPDIVHRGPIKSKTSGFVSPDDMFCSHDTVAIFFDGANFEASMGQLYTGGHIQKPHRLDYSVLQQFVRRKCRLIRIYYYAGVIFDRPDHEKMQKRLDWMEYSGITVKIKQGMRNYDNEIVKSNVDVPLALDMYRIAAMRASDTVFNVNHIVLFSGDSDFVYPIELIKDLGVRVTVVGSHIAKTLSDKLWRIADQTVELKDFIEHLSIA